MPIRLSLLRQRLAAGRATHMFKVNVPTPQMPELLGRRGFDCLWLDMEHLPTSPETMALLLQACRGVDADSVVRVPHGEVALAARMLDAGANAIMYPRCTTAEQVRELVAWTRFPPVGRRGSDPGTAVAHYGIRSLAEYLADGADIVLVVQIETAEAVANLEEIAAVPGIDVLFVGPGDLSVDLGIPFDRQHPELLKAVALTADAARRHGLHWGTTAGSPEHAGQLVAQGARLIGYMSETTLLGRELTAIHQAMTSAGFTYGRG
jgi:4-hydroxy-2-oxoheptanedioate aldolase